jgi:predicted nucleic acid-binding protein
MLLDASAFWRLASPELPAERRAEITDLVGRGLVHSSTPLVLETHAGRLLPGADPLDLPLLWVTERAEQRAVTLQRQLREAHQHLGVPPLDYLIVAIAEAHGVTLLHYDADFGRIAAHTDLRTPLEELAPLGTLP